MSYFIKPVEELPVAIHRIAVEQVAKARAALSKKEEQEEGIHKARKHFKKLRALVRLVRDDIGEQEYRRQNIYYRDLGRRLSSLRDATSLLESLQSLKSQFENQLAPGTFLELETYLVWERNKIEQEQAAQGDPLNELMATLENADDYISRLTLSPDHWTRLLSSLKRVYKRGLKGFQKSFDNPSNEDVHEWRKRVKYLWYQYRILKPAWHPVLKGFARETHRLNDLLGEHRDLTLLKERIDGIGPELAPESLLQIQATATRHQRTLLGKAQQLGAKIYAENPGEFKNRLEGYLQNWEGEVRLFC